MVGQGRARPDDISPDRRQPGFKGEPGLLEGMPVLRKEGIFPEPGKGLCFRPFRLRNQGYLSKDTVPLHAWFGWKDSDPGRNIPVRDSP